ncbi:MAG: peptidoglycan-associated lipoprotein Pal [Burkholderiales bacterium]
MKEKFSSALMAISVVLLAACASKEPAKEAPVETRTAPSASTTTAPTAPAAKPVAPVETPTVNPLKDPSNILSKRIIYFDYDKDVVKSEFQAIVQAHAKFLADNRSRKIRLEGHADERGSREYNMALGQRRADSVRKVINLLGVANDRMETISFGEDKPRAQGSTEEAWAQNRRVEIVYDGE